MHVPLSRDSELAVCVSYPHALARCGVRSDEELRQVRESEDDLRVHYADVGFVQPAVLKSDERDYVSYRMGSRIVWTSKPLLIRAGEIVLKDRAGNTIRARCGNRLSSMPRTPIAPYMPPEMDHEVPAIAGLLPEFPEAPELTPVVPELPFEVLPLPVFTAETTAPAPEESPFLPIVPVILAPIAPGIIPVLFPTGPVAPVITPVVSPPGTVSAVPEPPAAWLCAAGLLLLLVGKAKFHPAR
jgi:hypothetical protein